MCLTHWGRVTHLCVSKLTSIGSDNGLSPGRRQAIIWTNDGILLIGPLGTNFSETLSEIHTFSFKKMGLKMSSGKCRPFCLGLNVLMGLMWSKCVAQGVLKMSDLFGITPMPEPVLSCIVKRAIFIEVWIKIQLFSFKKLHLKMSSARMSGMLFSLPWILTGIFWYSSVP